MLAIFGMLEQLSECQKQWDVVPYNETSVKTTASMMPMRGMAVRTLASSMIGSKRRQVQWQVPYKEYDGV